MKALVDPQWALVGAQKALVLLRCGAGRNAENSGPTAKSAGRPANSPGRAAKTSGRSANGGGRGPFSVQVPDL